MRVSTIIDLKVKECRMPPRRVIMRHTCSVFLGFLSSLTPPHAHTWMGDLGLYCYSLVDRGEQSAVSPLISMGHETAARSSRHSYPICPHCNKHRCFKSAEWRDQTAALKDKRKGPAALSVRCLTLSWTVKVTPFSSFNFWIMNLRWKKICGWVRSLELSHIADTLAIKTYCLLQLGTLYYGLKLM